MYAAQPRDNYYSDAANNMTSRRHINVQTWNLRPAIAPKACGSTHIHAGALICAIERSCARLHVKEHAFGVRAVIDIELVVSPPA